ncbi:MAG: hypothetical protein MHM6MM_006357 [Cercozoa sp. M6MM]
MSPLLNYEVYDDVAFFWFILTVMGLIVVPRTLWHLLQPLLNRVLSSLVSHKETSPTVAVAAKFRPNNDTTTKSAQKSRKGGITVSRVAFGLIWVVFVLLLWQVPRFTAKNLARFDPYEILDLSKDASIEDIKRQFRKLSREWHPDVPKNRDNAEVAQKFMLLNKAKETLTDDATRENYEKYGNPDGFQGASYTIGMPSFLLHKDNQLYVLGAYMSSILLLAGIFAAWWRRSSQFHNGVHQDTLQWYFHALGEGEVPVRRLIDVISGSWEFKQLHLMPLDAQGAQELEELDKLLPNIRPPVMPMKLELDYAKRAWLLLHSHLLRRPLKSVQLRAQQLYVLEETHRLLEEFRATCVTRTNMHALFAGFGLSQFLTQALWIGLSPLAQLPHMHKYPSRMQALHQRKIATPRTLARLDSETRRRLLCEEEGEDTGVSAEHFAEIEEVLNCWPDMLPSQVDVTVKGSKEIVVGDVATFALTVDRLAHSGEATFDVKAWRDAQQAKKDANAEQTDDLAHLRHKPMAVSSYWPFEQPEGWYALLIEQRSGRLIAMEKLTSLSESKDLRWQVPIREKGKHVYEVHLVSDSYLASDERFIVAFEVKEERSEPLANPLAEMLEQDIAQIQKMEDEQEEMPWWYLGAESTTEFVISLFILYFAWLVFLSTSWGQDYVQPYIDMFWNFTHPVTGPVFDVLDRIGRMLITIRDPEQDVAPSDDIDAEFDHEDL